MIEKNSLRAFWVAMLLTASLGLVHIWFEDLYSEKIIGTFFIIGLANFLIWAPLMAYRFLKKS